MMSRNKSRINAILLALTAMVALTGSALGDDTSVDLVASGDTLLARMGACVAEARDEIRRADDQGSLLSRISTTLAAAGTAVAFSSDSERARGNIGAIVGAVVAALGFWQSSATRKTDNATALDDAVIALTTWRVEGRRATTRPELEKAYYDLLEAAWKLQRRFDKLYINDLPICAD